MSWQDDFQIGGGKRPRLWAMSAACIVVLLATGASYVHHRQDDVRVLSDAARERIIAMKRASD